MALDYKVKPLPAEWPGGKKTQIRRRAPFKSVWSRTLRNLNREIAHLNGRDIAIAVDVTESHIRQDGLLRADARPKSPAVILSFRNGEGERFEFPCDTFGFWQDNLDAIARAMEDLRRVDRYGVRSGRQYEGFKALPERSQEFFGPDMAAQIIAGFCFGHSVTQAAILESSDVARRAIRVARAKAHPDAGGSDEAFTRIGQCVAALEKHFGGPIL